MCVYALKMVFQYSILPFENSSSSSSSSSSSKLGYPHHKERKPEAEMQSVKDERCLLHMSAYALRRVFQDSILHFENSSSSSSRSSSGNSSKLGYTHHKGRKPEAEMQSGT